MCLPTLFYLCMCECLNVCLCVCVYALRGGVEQGWCKSVGVIWLTRIPNKCGGVCVNSNREREREEIGNRKPNHHVISQGIAIHLENK